MTRMSKQGERRHRFPRKHRSPSEKTGSLKDNLLNGFKLHENAVEGENSANYFIPKIK